MKRLTVWLDDGEERKAIPDPKIRANGYQKCCNKLAEYEDLEEKGVLLKLPCPIGAMVYKPFVMTSENVPEICAGNIDRHYVRLEDITEIGKTVFLTLKEAEEKLKELEMSYEVNR